MYHEVIDNGTGQGEVLLAEHEYNELGELIDKKLHSEDSGTNFKQSVDYRYNIRGWLKRINGAGLHNDGSEPQDYFGIEFYYQQVDHNLQNTPAYNGNISAVKWSNDLGLSDLEERGYSYTYDALNRLKSAQHHRRLNKNWGSVDAFSVSNINYDLNGNIENLTRKDRFGQNMDMLVYNYGSGTAKSNQLLSVTDGSGNEAGFKDGNTGSQDYFYDHNGNMEKDLNKGIGDIAYNHLNLPTKVTKDAANYIDYIYDATGVKLAQVAHENGKEKRTDYIGEFIYENDTLQLIQHEEGRIVKDETTESWVYQYHLKDHLGNTRLTFTTKPKTIIFKANYENDPDNADDVGLFEEVNISNEGDFNHTAGAYADNTAYSHAQVLRSSPHTQVGSVIAIPVGAGDRVTASAFAKYIAASEDPGIISTTLASALINAFTGGVPGVNEGGTNTINNNFGEGSLIGGADFPYEDSDAPKAFLNLIFLPEGEAIDLIKDASFAYDQIADGATESIINGISDSPYDELRIENFEMPQNGHILVYVSNEGSLTDIYFDDLEIQINESPVVQSDDYFPFGLTFNSYQRVTAKKNDFLFNGIERVTELDLGWDLAHFRAYDPAIGRWLQIDPKTSERESPYVGFANMPNFYVDPLGDTVRVLTTNDPRTNDGATYIADDDAVVVTAEQEVPATRSHLDDFADAFNIDLRPRQVVIGGDGPMGDDSHLPAPDPNAKTVNFDMEIVDALGALGNSKLKKGKAAKNSSGQTGRNDINDVTKEVFGHSAHNGTKRGVKEFGTASKPQVDMPDTISAKTVHYDPYEGKMYRLDTVKFGNGTFRVIKREIDKNGNLK